MHIKFKRYTALELQSHPEEIGKNSTAKGMRDYPVLLSVAETCRFKGLNFLSFLRTGAMDINGFAGKV